MDQCKYFQIEEKEISVLENNRCQAEKWSNVLVSQRFDPKRVRDAVFEGQVKIGALDGEIEMPDSSKKKSWNF